MNKLAVGFPGGWAVRNACSAGAAGDTGSIPGLGRSPEGGHGNPPQYSCLENPTDRGAWQAQSTGSQRVGHDGSDLAQGVLWWAVVKSLPASAGDKVQEGSLVPEEPPCQGQLRQCAKTTEPASCSYWKPVCSRACKGQQEKPAHLDSRAAPTHCS